MWQRWQRQIQSVRQSLSWLRASHERLRGVEYDVREPQARALGTLAGGACGVGGGLAQSCRPWIRVHSEKIDAFSYSNLITKTLLGALDFRFRPRGLCTSSIEDEHTSNEIGRENGRALRREKEQEEMVGRFETLLPKWNSNTPLLLNDLKVNSASKFACDTFLHVFFTACIRGAGLTDVPC